MQPSDATHQRSDRLLPWIAAERAARSLILLAVGIALLSHPDTNWASDISRWAQHLGLNPNDNWIRRIIEQVQKLHAHEDIVFGVIALAYGALEGTEAYGLFKRRPWGEWLTVAATSLLIIPEVWELTNSATPLKLGALALNLLVVTYLIWRLRRARR